MTGTMPAQPRPAAMKPDEFRSLILAAKVTQLRAAELLSVSRPTVVRWLAGRTPISRANARLITTVFKKKK